jgi:hypothetical protein
MKKYTEFVETKSTIIMCELKINKKLLTSISSTRAY